MKIHLKLLLLFFTLFGQVRINEINAQDFTVCEKKWMVQGGDTLPYRLLLPLNYDSSKLYPVLFFLHGAGERGRDNEKQLTHGAKLFLRDDVRQSFPGIIIFPQCAATDYWSNVLRQHDDAGKRTFHFLQNGQPTRYMELLQALVSLILQSYPVKKDQVYAGGLSMGGMGTYELVHRMPSVFTAAFAICGGAHPATAKKMNRTSWWIFHGLKDEVVPPQFSKDMAGALKAAGAKVRLTLYPEANHNSWDDAFAEKELLQWLFSHKKQEKTQGK